MHPHEAKTNGIQSFLRLPLMEKIKLSLKEVAGYENEGW